MLVFEGERFTYVVKGCNDPAYYISLFEESWFHPVFKRMNPGKNGYCIFNARLFVVHHPENHLKANNIRFTDVDVSRDQNAADRWYAAVGQRACRKQILKDKSLWDLIKAESIHFKFNKLFIKIFLL